jgi:hypothetical protein
VPQYHIFMYTGEGGLLSMPYLSVKVRRSSEMIQNISEKPSSPKISKEKVNHSIGYCNYHIHVYIYIFLYINIYIYIYK